MKCESEGVRILSDVLRAPDAPCEERPSAVAKPPLVSLR